MGITGRTTTYLTLFLSLFSLLLVLRTGPSLRRWRRVKWFFFFTLSPCKQDLTRDDVAGGFLTGRHAFSRLVVGGGIKGPIGRRGGMRVG
ncbi:hypothetical protein GGS23DRAFT_582961 [Durotheca rogersii]|uniref:uncharacterized protein n=1 Tax=Durotheca rogersii TaxID=419775 RepID=UPI00222009B7|nr:uncharacterized protein GGS23DRAFT_582961 [Durotheca rogersii]KAI5859914.1 hypothetical protein GGS23DRAFT_582961 [Durotheca rogersii]